LIDTKELRQTVSNALLNSNAIKSFCSDNFGKDTFFVFSGLDIENAPNLYPMAGVRVPKLTYNSSETSVIILVDLQILGSENPLKSGDVVSTDYYDAQTEETKTIDTNTMVTYDGEDILDDLRVLVVDEVKKSTDSLCNLTLKDYQWEQDLLTTFPTYSGFLVFEFYKENLL